MPFPSSEEGLESLLVIQPHLSWGVRRGFYPGPVLASRTNRRGQTAEDSRRPSPGLERQESGPGEVQDWPLVRGGFGLQDWILVLGVLGTTEPQKHWSITDQFLLDHLVKRAPLPPAGLLLELQLNSVFSDGQRPPLLLLFLLHLLPLFLLLRLLLLTPLGSSSLLLLLLPLLTVNTCCSCPLL